MSNESDYDLENLFHIKNDLNGRQVPLLSVYDAERIEDPEEDFDDQPWFMWVRAEGELHKMKGGKPINGSYFGNGKASKKDGYFDFLDCFYRFLAFPWVFDEISQIHDDVINLGATIAKMNQYNPDEEYHEKFIKTDIEYIFFVCRSIFESFQNLSKKLWENVSFPDRDKNMMELPKDFSGFLEDDEPKSAQNLIDTYGMPTRLAIFYESEAEIFSLIKDFRDKITHEGESVDLIYTIDEGFALNSDSEPFKKFEVWNEEDFYNDTVAPMWPPIAYVINATLGMMSRFTEVLPRSPKPIAPDHVVYMKGYFTPHLAYLPTLIQDDVWGEEIPSIHKPEYDLENT